MSGGVTSASPWEQLLTYPDIAVDERIEAAVTESMAPETLQEAIATVVDEQWDTNTLGVYNILSHANLITSVEKRVDVLLKALNGRVTALILAAAVYIGNSGPVCLGTRQADVIPVLLRHAVRLTGAQAHRCFTAAMPMLVHPAHTPVVSWLASNHLEKAVKIDALGWLLYALYGSSPSEFQAALSSPDASAYGASTTASIDPESLASVTLRFNKYCATRAANGGDAPLTPCTAYLPCYSELHLNTNVFPDVPFDVLCQMTAPFRKMDSDGDGKVYAGDVDAFFKECEMESAPSGASEVRRIGGPIAQYFTMEQWVRDCMGGGIPQESMG